MRFWLTLLLLLAAACAGALSWHWFAADPGYLMVRYGATSIETTLIFAVVAVLLAWALLYLVWSVLRAPLAAWSRRRRRRSRERLAGGLVGLAEGRYALALRQLERASQHSGWQGPALLGAACAAQARGENERAAALLARAPAGAALVLNARFQLEQQRPAQALALLKAQVDKSTFPPAGWPLLVEAALRSGVPATALGALPELARSQALPPTAFAALEARTVAAALAAAPNRDRLDELWSGLGKAQRRLPEAVVAYARRAAGFGDVGAAMSELESALRERWSEPLAVCYSELGPAEADRRLHYAEGMIAEQPNSPGLALTLGRLCIQCEEWGRARGYLERGLEIDPSPALWEALGDCHAGRDDLATAARCWHNALLAARGEPTQALPQSVAATALSTRAAIVEERSELGVPRLPGVARQS